MIAYQRLPASGQEGTAAGVNGIVDDIKNALTGGGWFSMPKWVKSYWTTIKDKIGALQALGPQISSYQQRIAIAQQKLFARGTERDNQLARSLDDELEKINDDLMKWWRVKGYIDRYTPEWMGLDQNIQAEKQGLGFVPIILGAAAIAALAYVVTTGMALYQDYQFKVGLTQDVIDQKISSGQAKDILSIPGADNIITKTLEKVGSGLGFGVPVALIVGAGLYVAFSTGLLNKLVNTLPFGRST